LENRIGGDDGTRGVVDSLSHQVASKSALFTSKSGSDRLERLARLVPLSWLTLDLIIHQSSDVVLKGFAKLFDSAWVCSLAHVSLELIVRLQDLLVTVGQVIFASVGA